MEHLYETGVAESIGADDDFLRRFLCPLIVGGLPQSQQMAALQ
jgi:hypothetical protein